MGTLEGKTALVTGGGSGLGEAISKDLAKNGVLNHTLLGKEVTDLLLPFFRDIMDVEFTAQMEEHLDKVEEGERKWADTVQEFYEPFKRDLAQAKKKMRNVKVGEETGEPCPDCGEPLLERWGRMGKFLGCSGYPECRAHARHAH